MFEQCAEGILNGCSTYIHQQPCKQIWTRADQSVCTGPIEPVSNFFWFRKLGKLKPCTQSYPQENGHYNGQKAAFHVHLCHLVSFPPVPVLPNGLHAGVREDGVPVDVLPFAGVSKRQHTKALFFILPGHNAPSQAYLGQNGAREVVFPHLPQSSCSVLESGRMGERKTVNMLPLGQCEEKVAHHSLSSNLPSTSAPAKPVAGLGRGTWRKWGVTMLPVAHAS